MIKAILIDQGDTLVDEATEVKDESGRVLSAELLPGALEFLQSIHDLGIPMILVMDGFRATVDNVFREHGLGQFFAGTVTSEEVGAEKPDQAIFKAAMRVAGIRTPDDEARTIHIGNRIDRDVLGANKAGLSSLWLKLKETYEIYPDSVDAAPHYIASSYFEAASIIKTLHEHPDFDPINARNGYESPQPARGVDSKYSVYAPIVLLDAAEPFIPMCVGVKEYRHLELSHSFPRHMNTEHAGSSVLEYSVWWDYDIGHLYELEHVWVFIDPAGEVLHIDTSQHGEVAHWSLDEITFAGKHAVVFAQPGKHALGMHGSVARKSSPIDRAVMRVAACEYAGESGVANPKPFDTLIFKNRKFDPKIKRYLKSFRFKPSFDFRYGVLLGELPMYPFETLFTWIPRRVNYLAYEINLSDQSGLPLPARSESLYRFAKLVQHVRVLLGKKPPY